MVRRKTQVPDRLLARWPAAALFFANVWPVGVGALSGEAITQAVDFRYPWVAAMLSGAALQLLIALLRSLFHERRDVMAAMREMMKAADESRMIREAEAQRIRHDLANRAHKAEIGLYLVHSGVPVDDLPEVRPLYDIDAEDRSEELRRKAVRIVQSGEIHLSRPPERGE